MPDKREQRLSRLYAALDRSMTALLATASGGSVTMRTVSPVRMNGDVLIFTGPDSKKYRQLRENPNCCLAVEGFFIEAAAEFFGPTVKEGNGALREAYSAKFPGAFDEGVEFGGVGCEFILLRPFRVSGWEFSSGAPTPEGIPDLPFEMEL